MLLFSSSLSPLWSHDQIMLSMLSCLRFSGLSCLLLEMLLLSESAWDIFAPQLCVLISLYQHVLPQQHYFKNAALFPPLSPTPCITFPRFKRHRLRYFPGGTAVKESACNAGDWGSIPWVGKIPWRRNWQPTPVFLPRESPCTEEAGRLQSTGSQESDMT